MRSEFDDYAGSYDNALNRGLLPAGYMAMAEQVTGHRELEK